MTGGPKLMRPTWGRVAAAMLLFALVIVFAVSFRPGGAGSPASSAVSDEAIMAMMARHCISCHAAEPTHPDYPDTAGALSLETLDAVREFAFEIRLQTVDSDLMPIDNETGMTDRERAMLGAWLDRQ